MTGKNGFDIASQSYISCIEKSVFKDGALRHFNGYDYKIFVKSALETVAKTLENDLCRGIQKNDYIKDGMADRLKEAIKELEKCGVRCYNLCMPIDAMSWYVGGNRSQIIALQKNLNILGMHGKNGTLKEDGVYGKETDCAVGTFFNRWQTGTVPTLTWIDPLQSGITGIEVGRLENGGKVQAWNAFSRKPVPIVRFDAPPPPGAKPKKVYCDGKQVTLKRGHLNVEFPNPTKHQKTLIRKYDHKQISDWMYGMGKDLRATGKTVRAFGKVFLIAGIALDTIDLIQTIEGDINDADKKLGKKSLSKVASIGGSWTGAALGAKAGAMAGAALGTFAFPGIGTVVGGAVLGIAGGVGGSIYGDKFARWVIDITCTEE